MNTNRIEEIQLETAYPDSHSVKQALLKVWNEIEQEAAKKQDVLDRFLKIIVEEINDITNNIYSSGTRVLYDGDGYQIQLYTTREQDQFIENIN